jgi:hypothetical protein
VPGNLPAVLAKTGEVLRGGTDVQDVCPPDRTLSDSSRIDMKWRCNRMLAEGSGWMAGEFHANVVITNMRELGTRQIGRPP